MRVFTRVDYFVTVLLDQDITAGVGVVWEDVHSTVIKNLSLLHTFSAGLVLDVDHGADLLGDRLLDCTLQSPSLGSCILYARIFSEETWSIVPEEWKELKTRTSNKIKISKTQYFRKL